jgi:hypothetical protein
MYDYRVTNIIHTDYSCVCVCVCDLM